MHPDERIEDLMIGNLRIIQKMTVLDLVLTASFVAFCRTEGKTRVLDIGTDQESSPYFVIQELGKLICRS